MSSKALAELGKSLSFYPKCKENEDCLTYFESQKITTGCCAKLSMVSPMTEDGSEPDNPPKLSWVFDYV